MSTREDRKARVERYVKDYGARELAEMLVELEDAHEKRRRPVIQIGDNNTMVVQTRRRRTRGTD